MKQGDIFAVVGLGLMGGSYAMGLTKQGYTVLAVDTQQDALDWARENGLIQRGAVSADAQAVADVLRRADYVLLALYPRDIVPWLQTHHTFLKPGALLTDLAGVKGCFVPQAQALLGSAHEFIPSHPMAGREVSGVQNANDGIFKGANFLITPTELNTAGGIAFARQLAQTLGFGRITQLTVQQHDEMIGYVSQLTHAIAVSLMNANGNPHLPDVTGDSFRDLTRIADINESLWSELFLANKNALAAEIDAFTACLQELKQRLVQDDRAGLEDLMRQSAQRRRAFGKGQPGPAKKEQE